MSSEDPHNFEPRPDAQQLTAGKNSDDKNDIDYEPHPENSIKVEPERQKIVNAITSLYSGSASEEDMQVYAEKAIYDDPWSYCDDRYKIAGQWYGIPKCMSSSKTLKTEIVKSTPDELIFKLQQQYTPRVIHMSKPVNSLISLKLDENGKVKYHKDMWNSKDYSHEGLGKLLKTLNGDHLTKITQPPKALAPEEGKA